MLAAGQRLRRRSDFAAAIKAGRGVRRGGLILHVIDHRKDGATAMGPRAGFVIPRQVGTAVQRNLLRRRLRHLLRRSFDTLPAGLDVVVRVQRGAAQRSFVELAADLDAGLRAALGGAASHRGTRQGGSVDG